MTLLENKVEVTNIIKEVLDEIVSLPESNPKMFDGLVDIVKPMYEYDYWVDMIDTIRDMVSDDEDLEEVVDSILYDKIGFEVLREFGEKWFSNLINMGFHYQNVEEDWSVGGRWNIGEGVSNYGLIWDYWVSLDTSPRETCSDIVSEIFNDMQPKDVTRVGRLL